MKRRIDVLERLIDELKEQNAVLLKEMGQVDDLPRSFALTKNEAAILGALLKRDICRKSALHAAIYGGKMDDKVATEKIIDVWVCKMRKKVEPFGIKIGTQWGVGYFMDEASKVVVREIMAGERGND